METIFFGLIIALIIGIIVREVLKNAKPTIIINGDNHNHYYNKVEPEKSKIVIDENILQAARYLGEINREIRGSGKANQLTEDRNLPE